ncbi:MAG: tetratricopeptide repeat-containing sulfotransferase family protein [Rhizomicrobium sp.]
MAGTPNALTAAQTLALARALQTRGQHAEAERLCRAAMAAEPGNFHALLAVGTFCLERRTFDEAASVLARAAAADPGSAIAHYRLGQALSALGRFEAAKTAFESAIACNPQSAESHGDLGNTLSALGRRDEAIARLKTALALAPGRAETENDLGAALAAGAREAEAIVHFDRAVALKPDYAPALQNLANALSAAGRHAEAVSRFEALVTIDPAMLAAHCGLGYALQMSDRSQEALDAYERALAIDPGCADAIRGRGFARQSLGALSEARADFEMAVKLAPRMPAYHRALAEAKTFGPGDAQIAAMLALAERMEEFPAAQQIELHFALAKAHQDLGEMERALDHLLAGNAMKRRDIDYDEAATLTMFRHIAQVFTPELLADVPGRGDPSGVPVFILGMPRSGSTLVEQILASHPRVVGGGELHHLNSAAKAFRGADVRAYFPEVARHLSPAQWRDFGGRYLEKLGAPADAARMTDKMPANFRFIGLIRMALPGARIIHTIRDPMDTCMSCFAKLFAGSQPYTYNLAELGRYFREYSALMAHWRRALPPGAMLEVRYEDLVRSFEPEARRIVDYCGLEWDRRVLDFHRTARPVRTASVTQVRQPIYATAIGRWKSYEMMLQPLTDELSIG